MKPLASCGNDSVYLITSEYSIHEALTAILGAENLLGDENQSAIVQERIFGEQYTVDSVSWNGIHKTVAIWKDDKRTFHNRHFIHTGMKLIDCESEAISNLVRYTKKVLDALGILYGPSHAEVMICDDDFHA